MMKRAGLTLIAIAAICLIAGESTRGQVRRGRSWYHPRAGAVGYGIGYPGFGFSGNWASTAAESRARGYADVVRAAGSYNVQTSEAMKNYEDTRSKFLDNKRKWQELYWDRKHQGEEEAAKRHARERERREKYFASRERTSSTTQTQRLTPSQLDPTTGKIYWPQTLTADEFATEREKLEELFVLRAHAQTSFGSFDVADDVKKTCDQMMATLKSNIKGMTPQEYISGRKFIEGLQAEIQHVHE